MLGWRFFRSVVLPPLRGNSPRLVIKARSVFLSAELQMNRDEDQTSEELPDC